MRKKLVFLKALMIATAMSFAVSGCVGTGRQTESVSSAVSDINEDYEVLVKLIGGSGKASVGSPATVTTKDGISVVEIVWSSSNYTYMQIGDDKYYPISGRDTSVFEIPYDKNTKEISFAAETTAMSTPHVVEYTLVFGEEAESESNDNTAVGNKSNYHIENLNYMKSLDLLYAKEFKVDFYENEVELITLGDGSVFVSVNDASVANDIKVVDEAGTQVSYTILEKPMDSIYLAASSTMNLFDTLDALDSITFSATKEEGWYIDNAKRAMSEGKITFAGKYSEPDYELLVSGGCKVAIESLMITHAPEVKEKLEELGIAVLVDQSSNEEHPLGRGEWIKLYGVLLGASDEAKVAFDEQVEYLRAIENTESAGKSVAFFYIKSDGSVVTRKSQDYMAKMITIAGGDYVFGGSAADDEGTSTFTLDMETFYANMKDVDFIIYNASIGSGVNSVDELIALNPLLADCKAVREGNVWCTTKSLYQETLRLGVMIDDLNKIFTGSAEDNLTFLNHIN